MVLFKTLSINVKKGHHIFIIKYLFVFLNKVHFIDMIMMIHGSFLVDNFYISSHMNNITLTSHCIRNISL